MPQCPCLPDATNHGARHIVKWFLLVFQCELGHKLLLFSNYISLNELFISSPLILTLESSPGQCGTGSLRAGQHLDPRLVLSFIKSEIQRLSAQFLELITLGLVPDSPDLSTYHLCDFGQSYLLFPGLSLHIINHYISINLTELR